MSVAQTTRIMLLLLTFLSSITLVHMDATNTELRTVTHTLSERIEKCNYLFLNTLGPRMSSAASTLSSIDINIKNLQERAHIWDTFQLHVSAWNDQLVSLDRKIDIISKGQEKIIALESNFQSIAKLEYKLDSVSKKLESFEESNRKSRSVLDIINRLEKKLELIQQAKSDQHKTQKQVAQCNISKDVEEVLNDLSTKVDIIFDTLNKEEQKQEYSTEDYMDDGSGGMALENSDRGSNFMKEINNTMFRIVNNSLTILKQQNHNKKNLEKLLQKSETHNTYISAIFKKLQGSDNTFYETLKKLLNDYHIVGKQYFQTTITRSNCSNDENTRCSGLFFEPTKSDCEDLDALTHKSGVYIFGSSTKFNSSYRFHNKRLCAFRNDSFWTVIQKRDNYSSVQSFEMSWFHYKTGFGNINKDFWLGNDLISSMSHQKSLILRVELDDFEGHHVWAEYSTFLVLAEDKNYQLIIDGYTGNASDSFSSHNSSLFSTMDKKNDQAPECCPCAITYGGGWWFNNCFESNLNGLYFKRGEDSGYFGGIIWENWLGNYSLKRTVMMVKSINQKNEKQTTPWPYYEDP